MARKSLSEMLSGETRFGRLTVIREVEGIPNPGNGTMRRVLCRCDCAADKVLLLQNVKQGKSLSCGCLSKDKNRAMRLKHGDSRSRLTGETAPEYAAHQNMINRCENPSVDSFPRYGGRGIRICDLWRGTGGYERFLSDLGRRPSSEHSIDRIDANGDYEPGNVQWATKPDQARNTRKKRTVMFRGVERHVADLAEEFGVRADVIACRFGNGWNEEEAVSQPVGARMGPRKKMK